MTTLASILALGLAGANPSPDTLPPKSCPMLRAVPVNIGLAPGFNANGEHPEEVANNFALNFGMNDAGAIRGVDLSLGLSRTRLTMSGIQITGGANWVDGSLEGLQMSLVNIAQGGGAGVQASNIMNLSNKDFQGVQASTLNLVRDRFDGLQAGVVNLAGSTRGAQFSLVNIGGNVSGAQFGLVNIGRQVHGVQFGLVNIADSVHGASVGLVNIADNIEHQVDYSVTESGVSNVGIVSGTENFYVGFHAVFDAPDRADFAGWGMSLGARIRDQHAFGFLDVNSSVLVHDMNFEESKDHRHMRQKSHLDGNQLVTARLAGGWRFYRHLEVYGGVSSNLLVSSQAPDDRKYLTPPGDYQWDASSKVRFWPGAFAGIRI